MMTMSEKAIKLEEFFGVERPDDVSFKEWVDTLENMEVGYKKKTGKDIFVNNSAIRAFITEKKITMITDGTFTSVWSNMGEVETNCKINIETKEVFDIGQLSGDIDYGVLEYEYVTLSTDGKNYPAYNKDDYNEICDRENCYWYR